MGQTVLDEDANSPLGIGGQGRRSEPFAKDAKEPVQLKTSSGRNEKDAKGSTGPAHAPGTRRRPSSGGRSGRPDLDSGGGWQTSGDGPKALRFLSM